MPFVQPYPAALALLALATPAAASEPGTVEEANALQQRIERYVGRTAFEEGSVRITPGAEGYRIELYLAPILSKLLHGTGVSLDIAPYDITLARRADGDWDVRSDRDEAIRIAMPFGRGGGDVVVEAAARDGRYEAVVSDRTGMTLSSNWQIVSGEMRQEDAISISQTVVGALEYRMELQERWFGRVDTSSAYRMEDLREVSTPKPAVKAGPGDAQTPEVFAAIGPITITAGLVETDDTVSGLRAGDLRDLWALAVARAEAPDGDDEAFRDDLRSALSRLGPVFDEIAGVSVASDVRFETPFGTLNLARVVQTFELDGLVWSGDYGYALTVEGIGLESEAAPAFEKDLLPRAIDLEMVMEALDLETPVGLLVDHLDPQLERLVPREVGGQILRSFKDRPPRLRVKPSRIEGEGYDVTVELEAEADSRGYGFVAKISASGLDGVISRLQQAEEVEALQVLGLLSFAKGFGRDEGDGRTGWTIERSSDGAVAINGAPVVPAATARR